MTRWITRRTLLLAGGAICLLIGVALMQPFGWHESARADEHKAEAQKPAPLDADKIGTAASTKATTTPDGVVRIAWPRTDVAVKVDGMPLKPFTGLGSWAAFTPTKHGTMVMGDTVVFQDEVAPAMDAAFAGGLEVTGLVLTGASKFWDAAISTVCLTAARAPSGSRSVALGHRERREQCAQISDGVQRIAATALPASPLRG